MASKNLLEAVCGIRFTSSEHWDPHLAVGFSSFFFGLPASAFLAVFVCVVHTVQRPYASSTLVQLPLYALLCLAYCGAVVTCGLADFVYIRRGHRSYYGRVDITFAAFVFFLSIFDFALRASLLETAALSAVAIGAFLFSGCSSSFEQWVFRHSLWHGIAGGVGTYGALRLPPEEARIAEHIWPTVFAIAGAYAALVAVAVASFYALTGQRDRTFVWELGAKYACWKCVVD